jgi:hypothetical protein
MVKQQSALRQRHAQSSETTKADREEINVQDKRPNWLVSGNVASDSDSWRHDERLSWDLGALSGDLLHL